MFKLPNLPYSFDALEPNIDAKTMEIHHDKHHATYVQKLNAALEGTKFANLDINELLKNIDKLPEEKRKPVINNGGGHANHSLFWEIMSPKGGGQPSGELKKAIIAKFESFENFKEQFANAALNTFGSEWAWLVINSKKLEIISTPNQNSPIMDGKIPILGLDVWEHAYYLKYQNKRADYITAFFNIINWKKVEELFKESKQ